MSVPVAATSVLHFVWVYVKTMVFLHIFIGYLKIHYVVYLTRQFRRQRIAAQNAIIAAGRNFDSLMRLPSRL